MLLEQTILQLDIGAVPQDRAIELGHLGYLQWLGSLPGDANYPAAAMHALTLAAPFMEGSPAVAVFCDALLASLRAAPVTLELTLPAHQRRGGSQARRGVS